MMCEQNQPEMKSVIALTGLRDEPWWYEKGIAGQSDILVAIEFAHRVWVRNFEQANSERLVF